jgi:hypothetical protein
LDWFTKPSELQSAHGGHEEAVYYYLGNNFHVDAFAEQLGSMRRSIATEHSDHLPAVYVPRSTPHESGDDFVRRTLKTTHVTSEQCVNRTNCRAVGIDNFPLRGPRRAMKSVAACAPQYKNVHVCIVCFLHEVTVYGVFCRLPVNRREPAFGSSSDFISDARALILRIAGYAPGITNNVFASLSRIYLLRNLTWFYWDTAKNEPVMNSVEDARQLTSIATKALNSVCELIKRELSAHGLIPKTRVLAHAWPEFKGKVKAYIDAHKGLRELRDAADALLKLKLQFGVFALYLEIKPHSHRR